MRERAVGRLGGVDVDPLVVAGRVSKRVNLLLADRVPFGIAQVGADGRVQLGDLFQDLHAVGLPIARASVGGAVIASSWSVMVFSFGSVAVVMGGH